MAVGLQISKPIHFPVFLLRFGSVEVMKAPYFVAVPLIAHSLGTYGPQRRLQLIFEGSLPISHSSQACFLFLSILKLHTQW